jgi:hypothetical protein
MCYVIEAHRGDNMDTPYEKPDFIVDTLGRITQYEMPDFIADAKGRVQDVRHLKLAQSQASQARGASNAPGGPGDTGPEYSGPMQRLLPGTVFVPLPVGLFALLTWLVLQLIAGVGN